MKSFRTFLFWCHLVAGVVVALIVLLMSVTGVLLTYERQMTAWADTRGLDGAPPTPEAERLDAEALVARVRAAEGAAPSAITWHAAPDAPAAAAFGRDRTVYVNAYTGAVLGGEAEGVRAFFREVMMWHRWLAAEGEGRDVGRAVTGACNLGFLFLILSGFYLWWPRRWTRQAFRRVAWFRRGLSPKARDFNWHNVIGFWSLVPLFAIVVSGVVISYPWAGDLVYTLVGEDAPQRRGRGGPGLNGAAPAEAPALADPVALDVLLGRAAERMPDWRTLSLAVPSASDSVVTVSLDAGTGGQPQKRAQVTLSRVTGAEVAWRPFEASSAGRRARAVLRFAHTGEVLGLVGQTLAGLVSLGAVVLVWTGLSLSWRRFRRGRRRAGRPSGARADGPSPRPVGRPVAGPRRRDAVGRMR